MRKSIFPVAILATLVLSPLKADSPDPTIREPGVNAPAARAIQGVPGGVPVTVSGSFSATTTGHATAAAPTYVEGSDNPLSLDLGGNIRTLATAQTAAKATAAAPTYVEGSTSPLSQDLSGNLRVHEQGTVPVTGTFWQATQPVSGTFWQVTQPVSGPLTDTQLRASAVPVSGTFWQATQPVSGPLTDTQLRATPVPVSGTFWQATQPVSGPLTDTQLRASAVPVSGTFWQATQPVSGTVTANQGTTPWIGQPQDIAPTTGTLTTNASTVQATLGHGESVCGLTITGTWTTTTSVLFETSVDGTNFISLACWGNFTGNYFSSTTANASWLCPAAGYKKLQARVNAGTWTGTANVQYTCTQGSQPPTAMAASTVQNGGNPTATVGSQIVSTKADPEGRLLVRDYGSNVFSNQQSSIAASAVLKTNVASLRLHVTDFHIVIVSGTTPTAKIVYGTGTTCATGITSLTPTYAAAGTYTVSLRTPLIAAASNDLCVIISGTTPVVHVLVSGYIAP